jgi:hypothetical protein
VRSNGEVEGPRAGARLEPPVHNLFQHRRRHHRTSRPPPTIVRGTAAPYRRHQSHLALTHRAHARNSEVKRSQALIEATGADCSRCRSGATQASAAANNHCFQSVESRTEGPAPKLRSRAAAETKGSLAAMLMRRRIVRHFSGTVPLTVKLRGRTEAPALGAEGAQSLSARGANPQARHGPLQRLLEVTVLGGTVHVRPSGRKPKAT